VPTPDPNIADAINRHRENGNTQKLKLFNLGKAMSGEPNNIGKNQFAKDPMNKGMTMKKIMIKA